MNGNAFQIVKDLDSKFRKQRSSAMDTIGSQQIQEGPAEFSGDKPVYYPKPVF